MAANPTLKGLTVLFTLDWLPSVAYCRRLQDAHPDLNIIVPGLVEFGGIDTQKNFPVETWKIVTTLITWNVFPSREQAPLLSYVQVISAGCNHVVGHPLFQESGITFCTSNGVHAPQIAEYVIAAFLSFQHHFPFYTEQMKTGNWIGSETDEDVEDAVGLRIGIMGYGCIGRQIARVAKALSMDIYAYTLHPRPTPESRHDESFTQSGIGDPSGILPSKWFSGSSKEAINEFLAQDLDVLVLATPLTPTTTNMISGPQFQILGSKKTFLVNIGRGKLVNTDELINALNEEVIRGAAIDVTDPEPLPKDHALWKAKNLMITPHTSGNSNHHNERVLALFEQNLARLSEGKNLINVVNKELGY
ncbi:D-isomer specific 2-hydroxyacid dehydrogenase [Patellaria atrata CBS 101060]|uniref:D-isomer specific 2-hydroxyacid dehydrogenase n=1 Tax=Patellaria atrata CBS 101060 TaxID=1346257 RepID=A0A9P4S8D9_9PEZI|nr:D-isomer specific 2-hydroxyacid dehydrogenase [Patellaria atrata CBS 101060]